MWYSNQNKFPAKGFSTPPAACLKSPDSFPAMPMSERKSNFPSGCRRDLFHVVHKVPAGDSPYVRAKHVQLIDKDPGKAISLFWAAINAGDRVDSALKDMAVVMKQLDRSDEAIEAIKSFRHLCPFESQESLDNVLVELYKRSGRIEEEIEMLHRKLNIIDEGIAFGGKRTKIGRSQGKKIQITVEQERSRILGNLAWAYMQHHDYGLAENFYRQALAFESDNNKKCNLAICLLHMKRIPEAKSILQGVKASCATKEIDESYAKSFERAVQMLNEVDLKSVLKPTEDHSLSYQIAGLNNEGRKGNFDSPTGLYTQPRNVSWRRGEGDETRRRFNEDEPLMVHTIRNLDGVFESDAVAASKSESDSLVVQVKSTGKVKKSWADMAEEEERRLLRGENLSPYLNDWNEGEWTNENLDSNRDHQSWSAKSSTDVKDKGTPTTNQPLRRSLCFDGRIKNNRLQVFRDITPSEDGPCS